MSNKQKKKKNLKRTRKKKRNKNTIKTNKYIIFLTTGKK